MAEHLTGKQIVELKEAFSIFDKNGDGFIKKAQVKSILVSLGMDGSSEEVKKVIEAVDIDGDGVINFPEFLHLMANDCVDSGQEPTDELEHMFKIFDRDGDGLITHTEMKKALDEMSGGPVPHEEVEEMIKEADSDGDGTVSFSEFKAVMKKKYPDQYQ